MALFSLEQFLATWDGRKCDWDGRYGNTCVDIAQQYTHDVLGGVPLVGQYAVDIWSTFDPTAYRQHPYIPGWFARPGDLVIWTQNAVAQTTSAGHIAICVSATAAGLLSMDQDFPYGSACHLQYHPWDGVLGSLAPLLFSKNPPRNAADAVDTLSRHAASLTAVPSVADTNTFLQAVRMWPVCTT
jgi:hypothetical protein